MSQNLLETYKRRLALSESVYKKSHDASMSVAQKAVLAQTMRNTSLWLNENFGANSVGTQRADMGTFKKFTLDIITVAVPTLIANDLVIVQSMGSITGNIQYIKFVAGSNKGGIEQGTVFNSPFALGAMTPEREAYTTAAVVDVLPGVTDGGEYTLAWTPLAKNFTPTIVGGESGAYIEVVDAETGRIKVHGATGDIRVKYLYNNVLIPQDDIPHLNMVVDGTTLEAKPRRLAIYYSQMAAFQAKVEMGLDLGDVLSTQAVGEVHYEIDTEVVNLLVNSAPADVTVTFDKRVPVGVSISQHYESFRKTLIAASNTIYKRTGKYTANYVLAAPDLLEVFGLLKDWKPSGRKPVGPYYAGTAGNLKVYISPAIPQGKFAVGFHGDDLATSAAVLGLYMPIVPTTPMQFSDGGTAVGFSTLYALKLLNPCLLVAGEVVDTTPEATETIAVING